jgi:AraC-like DNA-binding protein
VHDNRRVKFEDDGIDRLSDRRAFYAEFGPLPQCAHIVGQLYVMKDCGIMTADRRAFASPLMEIAFLFANAPDGSGLAPRIVVVDPSFGHRSKRRAFHGWVFGIKCRVSPREPLAANLPFVVKCQSRLEVAIGGSAPITSALDALDSLCRELSSQAVSWVEASPSGERTVAALAARQRRSARTVQRDMKAATGLPPKRLLAVERFCRAVSDVPTTGARLSEVADALGFADQAHMTREFKRHAGLSPGAFQRTWRGDRGETVRFVQDADSGRRLRLVVAARDDHR